MNKVCTTCKQELPATTEFFASRTDKKVFTLQSSCRVCHSEYRKNHYAENKEKYIKKAKVYNSLVFEWFIEFKKTLKCEICNENRHWVLDFHHSDPSKKDGNIAIVARRSGSKTTIIKEIEKCKILCSNCHRDLHYNEKLGGACSKAGESHLQ